MEQKEEGFVISGKRDMEQLVKRVRRLGHEVEISRGCHYKVFAPDGIVFISYTPGDRRALAEAVSDLRRNGVNV